jgi:hypothetical protein
MSLVEGKESTCSLQRRPRVPSGSSFATTTTIEGNDSVGCGVVIRERAREALSGS